MNLGMLKLFRLFFDFIFFTQSLFANTQSIDFDFIKKGIQDDNTLLIVGGIQGDEPGAFMAASLITTHYKIKKRFCLGCSKFEFLFHNQTITWTFW